MKIRQAMKHVDLLTKFVAILVQYVIYVVNNEKEVVSYLGFEEVRLICDSLILHDRLVF